MLSLLITQHTCLPSFSSSRQFAHSRPYLLCSARPNIVPFPACVSSPFPTLSSVCVSRFVTLSCRKLVRFLKRRRQRRIVSFIHGIGRFVAVLFYRNRQFHCDLWFEVLFPRLNLRRICSEKGQSFLFFFSVCALIFVL